MVGGGGVREKADKEYAPIRADMICVDLKEELKKADYHLLILTPSKQMSAYSISFSQDNSHLDFT